MIDILFQQASDGRLYFVWLLSGLLWTICLAISAWAIAFTVGVVVGAGRTVESKVVSGLCRVYIEVFRNIPILVQMFLWYFVLPELLPLEWGNWLKQLPPPWGSFCPAVICLGLYTASRVAEQVRAGIEALPLGQFEAAKALGLNVFLTYRLVILPQGLRLIVPSLTSEVMAIYKNTSVALAIGLLELTSQARQMSEATFQTFTAFAAATVMYLLLALIAYQVMAAIDRGTRIPSNTASSGRQTIA